MLRKSTTMTCKSGGQNHTSVLTRKSRPAKPTPNPDDAGQIERRLVGLPVAAGCGAAWD